MGQYLLLMQHPLNHLMVPALTSTILLLSKPIKASSLALATTPIIKGKARTGSFPQMSDPRM
jgi:hypothetical protein